MKRFPSLAVAIALLASPAASAAVELLGRPSRARNILEGHIVLDHVTGRPLLAMSNNNEGSGMEMIFLDYDADTARVLRAPAGAGAESIIEVPGDRLILGTFYDGTVMVFDLKKMEFVKTQRFQNETYIWGFAIGGDGRVYFGTSPSGKLGALDLNTYALEDLGAPAAPNYFLRRVVALPDGRIICRFSVEKPVTLLFNPFTRTFDSLPYAFSQTGTISVWNNYAIARNEVFEGPDFRLVARPPFPLPPMTARLAATRHHAVGAIGNEWVVNAFLTTRDVLYFYRWGALWRYSKNETASRLVADLDLRGGRILAETLDGRFIGVRGQDYFVLKPGDTTLELRRIPGDSAPRNIAFLKVDPTGMIWGGPPYGQTLFWTDPKSKVTTNTQNISDRGGEVYDVAFYGGSVFAAAYSGGEIIRYDPRRRWDQWNQTNPTTIASIVSKGFVRPSGGIIVGPGNKLYSGWMPGTGFYGGAVAITDPNTGDTEVLENPLGRQQIMGVATDGKLVYIGSGTGGSGLPYQPGESSKIGIIDPATRRIVWQTTVEGTQRIRLAGYDGASGIIPAIVDNRIRLFDTVSRTFVERGQNLPSVSSWSNGVSGDGRMYYGSAHRVLALDLFTGVVQTIAEVAGIVENVAVGPDRTIYFSAGIDLYAFHAPGG